MKMPEINKSNLTKLVGLVVTGFVVWLLFSCSAKEPVVKAPISTPVEVVVPAPVEEPAAPVEESAPVVEPEAIPEVLETPSETTSDIE